MPNTVQMAGSVAVSMPRRMPVPARTTPCVSPMPETAECHDAEAGGTKQETRDVEIHRRREV